VRAVRIELSSGVIDGIVSENDAAIDSRAIEVLEEDLDIGVVEGLSASPGAQ